MDTCGVDTPQIVDGYRNTINTAVVTYLPRKVSPYIYIYIDGIRTRYHTGLQDKVCREEDRIQDTGYRVECMIQDTRYKIYRIQDIPDTG